MIDVNIRGVALLHCSAVITPMVNKKSGHIVNISSIAGRIVYSAGVSTVLQSTPLQHSAKALDRSSVRGLTYGLRVSSQE